MRVTRLFAVVLVVLLTALLAAPTGGAEEPARLTARITDHVGALSGSQHADVQGAVNRLYADRQVRLWVIYVDSFSGQNGDGWGRATARLSDLGDHDALLAVATLDRSYAFLVSTTLDNISENRVAELRRNQIEPALGRDDWAGAAVAAADGLNRSLAPTPLPWRSLLIGLGVLLAALVVLAAVLGFRRKRQRAAEFDLAQRVDATDPEALAKLSVPVLDDLSRLKVVAVDNALRTSVNELELAVDEFGAARTEPFTQAVAHARAALTQAFNVRHQLDDAIPETPAQQREMLTGVIVSAARADRELEAQRDAFEQLRDLLVNAPARLDTLTQQLVELTADVPGAERRLAQLHTEFDAAALASVADNVPTAQKRISFADRNITRARELAARPAAGRQGELVDTVRAAESALGQARSLLDTINTAATDIRHAVATLPGAIIDIEAGIAQADTLLHTPGPHTRELTAARAAANAAVAAARGSSDPLGAFSDLTRADADLDKLLDTIAEEQAAAERLRRALEQALFTAQARVRATSDYIDTRRGSIGPEARTRLAEARRHLEAAQAVQAGDVGNVNEALSHANTAASLAAQAQASAKADVQAAQRTYTDRYGGGDNTGAMLGGIIIGNILGGGRGGGSGWSPTSFGGSGGGGGFFGGGGRF